MKFSKVDKGFELSESDGKTKLKWFGYQVEFDVPIERVFEWIFRISSVCTGMFLVLSLNSVWCGIAAFKFGLVAFYSFFQVK